MTDLAAARAMTAEQISALDYESARDLLNHVVGALEDSSLPLADLMQLWELGERVANVCEAHLQAASEKMQDGLPTE